jgi:NAD(P)-dependent dehydrogenase (short-subunit alcohol dehydrogenase family)
MLNGLEGKAAIVTGAGGGIGQAVTRRLLEEGTRVLAVDLRVEPLRELAAKSDRILLLETDVTESASASTAVDECVAAFGAVDLFFANAGVESAVRPVVEFDADEYRRVFEVNVLATFFGAQAAVRQMLKQSRRGSILFMASTGALRGTAGMAVYAASKHAVLGMSRCLAREVGGQGIRVNTICPGAVDTPMMAAINKGRSALMGVAAGELRKTSEANYAAGRYARPDEVAAAAAWVLSDECQFLHDEVITLSGGSL